MATYDGERKALWIALFAILFICFSGIPIVLRLTKPPEIGAENCRYDGVLPAHTVVLIDQSDPFDDADAKWAWQLIFDEAKQLRKYGRLTVLGINEERPEQGVEVFSRCSPGSPSRANPIFENPRFIRQDWKQKFEGAMQDEVADLMLNKRSKVSPLIEHIRGILRRSDFRTGAPRRRIVIVSDLYQNSGAYSMYDSGLNQTRFDRALADIEFPEMEDVEFALFRVDRDRAISGQDLIQFWTDTLTEKGASKVEIIRD